MNHVERFRALANFEPVDRLPRIEWASWWDQTVVRWQAEGLPTGDRYEMYRHFGLDPYWQWWFGPRAATLPAPAAHGQGCVATMDDYERVLPHLYPPPDEAVEAMRPWAEAQGRGEAVVWITLEGFFWFPRTLLGIEGHLYALYDQPDLVHRMNRDLVAHHLRTLEAMAPVCRPAFMTFAEDMSYNHGPMISKAQFDAFVGPYYRQVVPRLEELGIVPVVDSDGDVTRLAPWLMEVGVRGVLPLERQAGVDAAALRAAHPRLVMIGHYDKMVMTRGEAAMRAEFERLLPVMRSGGFIPSVDHQTPPGVSLDAYRVFVRLLHEYTVRAAR
ncbi:MAG: hypothetical protein IMZ66_02910 [Planctomycetes bacterium]|nr:hypothetical protein [Planctomycetota bacterium]